MTDSNSTLDDEVDDEPIEDSRETCWFWESHHETCRFESLIPGSEPCADCPGQDGQEPEDVLYIKPGTRGTAEPVIDSLTRKMAAAYRAAESSGVLWRGFHICRCGARSTNTDYILPGGATTNSLCVHYLAFHRDEAPEAELAKVAGLASGEAEPNAEELAAPAPLRRPDSR
jgi:hypothetical protein